MIKTPNSFLPFFINRQNDNFILSGLLKRIPLSFHFVPRHLWYAEGLFNRPDINWIELFRTFRSVCYSSSVFPEISPINMNSILFSESIQLLL